MDPSTAISILIPSLLALVVARRGFRVDDEYVDRWAGSANVELTEERRPVLRRYLAWSRRSRTAGALAGFLAPVVASQIAGTPEDPAGWSVVLMITGYLLGALFAEIVIHRPRPGQRIALLVPRRLGDYLPRHVLVLQRVLGILAGSMVVVYALVEPHARLPKIPSIAQAAALGLTGVVIAVGIEALERRIVARRQPAATVGDVELDDAMRSSSLHVLAGVGVALLVYIAGGLVLLTIASAIPEAVFEVIGIPLTLLLFASALFAWAHLSKPNGFTVRRGGHVRMPAGVSA